MNRARILLEILKGIREAAPALHITTKINCSDFTYGRLTPEESLTICRLLDRVGIDSIEVSGNGASVGGIRAHRDEGYFVQAAAAIAEAVSCPVIVVGGFRSLDTVEAVLNKTKIEAVSLSRPLLREPDLPEKWQQDPTVISKCISCNRCYQSEAHRCIFRGEGLNHGKTEEQNVPPERSHQARCHFKRRPFPPGGEADGGHRDDRHHRHPRKFL